MHLAVSLSAPEWVAEPELMAECTCHDPFLNFPDRLSNPSPQVAPAELRSPPVQKNASLCEAVNWPGQCLAWKNGSKGLNFSAWKYPTWNHTLGKTVSLGLE